MNATVSAADLAALLESYARSVFGYDYDIERCVGDAAAAASRDATAERSDERKARLCRVVLVYRRLWAALGAYAPILEMRRGTSCECDDGTKVRRTVAGYEYNGQTYTLPELIERLGKGGER